MIFLVIYIYQAFDSRSFHLDMKDSLQTLFVGEDLQALDNELDSS
jgi:hypothetical protein